MDRKKFLFSDLLAGMAFTCKTCQAKLPDVDSFVLHFEIHHKVSNLSRFCCGFDNCFIQSCNGDSFRKHISLFHATQAEGDGSAGPLHETKILECLYPSCMYTCTVPSTLRAHRKRKSHYLSPADSDADGGAGAAVAEGCEVVLSDDSAASSQLPYPIEANCDSMLDAPLASSVIAENSWQSLLSRRNVVGQKFSHFYMSLTSKYHIPESTIQFMINTQHFLQQEAGNILTEELVRKLMDCKIATSENLPSVKNIVSQVVGSNIVTEVHDPKGPLRTMYMRRKMYHSGQMYVAPVPFKLGRNGFNKKKYGHYIPVNESLENLFEDESIYEQYLQSKAGNRSEDGMIRDIHDGTLIMNHPVLSQDPSALGIMLYQDDLEIANAIGSARGLHKINSFYYTLSNLQPWSRMNLKIIKLALIVAEKDVVYFGLRRSIKPLLAALKELEQTGIVIRGERLRVVVVNLLGDNLGTHMFIGLLENFSKSKYFCRYCEEPREEWRRRWKGQENDVCSDSDGPDSDWESDSDSDSEEENSIEIGEQIRDDAHDYNGNDFEKKAASWIVPFISAPLRTTDSYDKCVEQITKSNSKEKVVKGVVAKCPLNDLQNFHCIGSSPPCIAHDLFEGVIAYDLALVVNYFLSNYPSTITVDYINRRIRALKMKGSDQGDKPALVKENMKKLRGNAVQNWTFLRFLPYLVGSKVKKEDPVWRMTLKLIEITRVLTSPAIARTELPQLKKNINLYLKMRVLCFPNVPLKPKHHFLEHYAELIEIFGCLMRVGTLGCESKHRFFKNTAASKKNFKNITETLSEEHQLSESAQSVEHLITPFPIAEKFSPFEAVTVCNNLHASLLSYFGSDFLKSSAVSEKVRFRGTWYSKGEAVVTAWDSDSIAQMCLVELLIISGKNCFISG